jgi:4-amino-4-deoxy-L-arabinose transferase-like glycosyltransferase
MSATGGQHGAQAPPARKAGHGWAGWLLLLAIAAAGPITIPWDRPALLEPDEARSALIARLMAERGDWLVPHLPAVFHHDYPHDPVEGDLLAYWDKPPLYFWLAAAAMKVLGPTALAARLPSVLAQIATVLLIYAIGRSLWSGRSALLAALITALAPLAVAMGNMARMDALLVALMTAMLLAILRLLVGRGRPWVWVLVLYVAAGLGLLTKGPEAVVFPAAAVGITVLVTGRWRDLWRLRPLEGTIIALAVAAPWFLYMHYRYPAAADGQHAGFAYEFFIRQHLGRATSGELGQKLPPGTLVGIVLAGLLPWTIFLPGACVRFGREIWRDRGNSSATVLLLVWPLLIVGVFSLLKTAMLHYVAPAIPPLAIITAAYMTEKVAGAAADRRIRTMLVVTLILTGAAAIAMSVFDVLTHPGHLVRWDLALLVLALGLLAGYLATIRRGVWQAEGHVTLLLACCIGLFMQSCLCSFFSADPAGLNTRYTTRPEILAMQQTFGPGDAVIAYPYQPYSFAWYLWGQPVLYPTLGGSPAEAPSEDVLVAELNRPRRTFCLLQKRATIATLQPRVRWPLRLVSEEKSRFTLIVADPSAVEEMHE